MYKLSFGSSNYKWDGHNNVWSAKFGISRNSAKDMYSGTVNWIGDSSEKERIYIDRIETFFNGEKIDSSEINRKYYDGLPFAEFQQDVEGDTKVKIIIFGEIGKKGFSEELTLSRE
ncbi:DUF4944 domain-containing protein [Listeria weihenstephanensis]|uniref:DUF4944 domain-containing protein n=1 Tax=Listeria weihenstephanensis TaxID=1006155 RepID=A0A841Z4X3_9LIST|nr:DUF4944 domain-containing protein [Listeria weihenstephanensis]MBC1500991.1 DUF4944 domain-containing protein [Listeria weihenstephanensis]